MRLPDSAHSERPWRIHELASDFRLEDVWALPAQGGLGKFRLLVEWFTSGDPVNDFPRVARSLFVVRERLGARLGWDAKDGGLDPHVVPLRDRLPADLRARPGPEFKVLPAKSLYLLEDEWAAEVANKTVHGILHLGWVRDRSGGYRGQMAVLVKPNGLFGKAYMAGINPFRHRIVYPALMRQLARDWEAMTKDEQPRRRLEPGGRIDPHDAPAHTREASD